VGAVAPVVESVADPVVPVVGGVVPVIAPVAPPVGRSRGPASTVAPFGAVAAAPATGRLLAPVAEPTRSAADVAISGRWIGAARASARALGAAPGVAAPVLVPGPRAVVAPARVVTMPVGNRSLFAPAAGRPTRWLPGLGTAAGGVSALPWSSGPRGVTVAAVSRSASSVAGAAGRAPLAPVAPAAPTGAGSGASVGGGLGGWSGGPGALLLALFVLALCGAYRFLFAPAVYRPVAFVSLVERPG